MKRKPFLLVLTVLVVLAMALAGCRGRKAIPDLPSEAEILIQEASENTEAMAQTVVPETEEPPTTEEPEPQEEPDAETPAPEGEPDTEPAPPETTVEEPQPVVVSTPEPAETATGPRTHVVQAGQNLFRIALMYGTTVEAIAAANNITNPSLIAAGQTLTIPAATAPSQPTQPPAQQPGAKTYVVQPGDNLFRIALRYNLDQYFLARYNGIQNPSLIYVGQVIRIP